MAITTRQTIPRKFSTNIRKERGNPPLFFTTGRQKLSTDTKAAYDEENYLFFCIVGTKSRNKTKVGIGIFLCDSLG